jgi:hypothetical protein
MDFKNFKKNVTRTLPDLGGDKINYAHMIMGIFSELNELEDAIDNYDYINISEEASDCLWYLAGYDNIRKTSLFVLTEILVKEKTYYDKLLLTARLFLRLKPQKELANLYKSTSVFCDFVKKNIAYNREIDLKTELLLYGNVVSSVVDIFDYYGIDIYSSMENVINKLKVRFPDKFTDEYALSRNLELERKELEK